MRISVADLMEDPDFTESITLRHPTGGSYSNGGVYVPTYAHDATVTAIVQPADVNDVVHITTDGMRVSRMKMIFTRATIQAGDGKAAFPDIFVIGGVSYKVLQVSPWGDFGYTQAIVEAFIT